MESKQKIIIGSVVAIGALIIYAIYTDLSRFFPDKDKCCDKDGKCKKKS